MKGKKKFNAFSCKTLALHQETWCVPSSNFAIANLLWWKYFILVLLQGNAKFLGGMQYFCKRMQKHWHRIFTSLPFFIFVVLGYFVSLGALYYIVTYVWVKWYLKQGTKCRVGHYFIHQELFGLLFCNCCDCYTCAWLVTVGKRLLSHRCTCHQRRDVRRS